MKLIQTIVYGTSVTVVVISELPLYVYCVFIHSSGSSPSFDVFYKRECIMCPRAYFVNVFCRIFASVSPIPRYRKKKRK